MLPDILTYALRLSCLVARHSAINPKHITSYKKIGHIYGATWATGYNYIPPSIYMEGYNCYYLGSKTH